MMIALETAQDILWNFPLKGPGEEGLPLLEAQGRVLSRPVEAAHPLPPFDRSPLDGYALRGEDTLGASHDHPHILQVIEEIPAGHWGTSFIGPGQAARIFTGAPIPQGANAVLRQEDTVAAGGQVQVLTEVQPTMNICRAGEDLRQGEQVLAPGLIVSPAELGILAALGVDPVPCYRKPKVALLSTGDELLDVKEALLPGKIRNSNLYMLAGLVTRDGGEPLILPVAKDRREEVEERLAEGLAQADLVISTGGVSVGEYDVVKEAHQGLGAQQLFWKLAMKPGTPMTAARLGNQLLIGLSGNPASATITYELTVRSLIRHWAGRRDWPLERVAARLDEPFNKSSGNRRFLRGRLTGTEEGWRIGFTGKQNPGVMKSLLECNCLVEVGADQTLQRGQRVEAILL